MGYSESSTCPECGDLRVLLQLLCVLSSDISLHISGAILSPPPVLNVGISDGRYSCRLCPALTFLFIFQGLL